MEYLLYPHQHFFDSENTLTPNTTYIENESYLHITSPITHFQSVDQYYTIFKIKRRPFNNQLDFWQNLSEKGTLLVLIINN